MSDLVCKRGDTESYRVPVVDELGNEVDITSAVLRFMVKVRKSDRDAWALIAKETGDGIDHQDPPNGIAVVSVDPADTRNIQIDGNFFWDVQMEAGGEVITIDEGTFTLVTDVTRTVSP